MRKIIIGFVVDFTLQFYSLSFTIWDLRLFHGANESFADIFAEKQ